MKFETFICGIVPFLVVGLLKSAFAEQQRQPSSEFLNELSIGLKNDWTYKLIEVKHSAWFEKVKGSLRGQRRLTGAEFHQSGFVYHNLYVDSGCDESATNIYGEAANQCFELDGTSYMYRIAAADSCAGAVVEYYSDAACGTFVGSSPLEPFADICEETALSQLFASYLHVPVLFSLKCSSSAIPIVPQQPFFDPSCAGLDASFQSNAVNIRTYTSFTGYYSEAATCSPSSAIGFFFNATTTDATSVAFTAVCFRNQYTEPMATFDDYYGYSESADSSVSLGDFYSSEDGVVNDDLPSPDSELAYEYSDFTDTIQNLAPLLPGFEAGEDATAFEPPTLEPPAYASDGEVPQMDPSVEDQDEPQDMADVADVEQLSFFLGYCAHVLTTTTVPAVQMEDMDVAASALRPVPAQGAPCTRGRAESAESAGDEDTAGDMHGEAGAAVEHLSSAVHRRSLMTAAADLPAHTPAWKIYQSRGAVLLAPSTPSAPAVLTIGAAKVPVWVVGGGAVLLVLLAVAAWAAPKK